jgi:hypothetical protein
VPQTGIRKRGVAAVEQKIWPEAPLANRGITPAVSSARDAHHPGSSPISLQSARTKSRIVLVRASASA